MLRFPSCLTVTLLSLASFLHAQSSSPAKSAATNTDYSQEGFIVEQSSHKEKFENDGTSSSEDEGRVRIQSEAGVQRYGLLTFSYPSATGTFQIDFVRVRKPDGSSVETPPENMQDMPAQITREAPFYSDLHEKHVAVKGLSVGDVLEFRTQQSTTKPLAPGQFWASYRFTDQVIVLDERLEISVPKGRAVRIKSTRVQPEISEAGNYRVYSWHHSSLERPKDTDNKGKATEHLWQQIRGLVPGPDVLMSSFASWEEMGRWYGGLQDERVKPSPEVAAKAAEITKTAATDDAKVRALYAYVSTQFRYIGVSFGIGRYQPHNAAEVLGNQYGDCKDKHTLLASMLAAVGIPAYPALISTTSEVDPDVPSPGQFDHVITLVPKGDSQLWLDTTTEVGPFQFLVSPLRDKNTLVIWKDKAATLAKTPVDIPYPSTQDFKMEAKLNDTGTLEGQVTFSARGDLEYLMRNAFRLLPLPQWRELGQRVSASFGFGGEVSEVTATSPEKTDEAFHIAYKYTRKQFGDWPNHRIVTPAPFISMLAPTDEDSLPPGPSWLGPLFDIQCHGVLTLPAGYRPELPSAIHLKKDFAQYDSTYVFQDGKLISERRLTTFLREVPEKERAEYKEFMKAVFDDYGVFIPLSSGLSDTFAGRMQNTAVAAAQGLRSLPDTSNEEAARLEKEAQTAIQNNDMQNATSSLYRAVAADPKFARAWVTLGTLLLSHQQKEAGIEAFHKAMAVAPEQAAIPKALGVSLMATSQFDDAVTVWQDYIKGHPDDFDGPANLGNCLLNLKRYPEAATAFEAAVKINGDHDNQAALQARLGSIYLQAGDRAKADAVFTKIAELDPDGLTFNDVAYEMASADLNLPRALEYSRKAVRRVEAESQKITLSDLKMENVRAIQSLAAYWDTLGWVEERMSKLDEAEQYLRASWRLTQDGVVAGHLCHLYRREHKTDLAVQNCRLALYRMQTTGRANDMTHTEMNAAKENLTILVGAAKAKDDGNAGDIVIRQRTFKLARFLPGTESAEFFVLLASDGKGPAFSVQDVKFISGSNKMKTQGRQLKSVAFDFPAPPQSTARFVRRGILGCYEYSGCSFVLLDPPAVGSLD